MIKKFGVSQGIDEVALNYNDAVGLLPNELAEKGDQVMRRTAKKLSLDLNSDRYRFYRTRSISSGGDIDVEYLSSRQAKIAELLRLHGENGNGDYFERDQLQKYYRTFVEPLDPNDITAQKPALCCVNHKYSEDGSSAIGYIVVAYYNQGDFPNGQYVENIRAIDKDLANKRYGGLIEALDSGKFTDTSMGVMCEESICSVCGSVARNEIEFCDHARNKYALRARGENVYEINRGLDFFEDSFIGDESLLGGGRHSYVLDISGSDTEGADPNAKVLQIVASKKPQADIESLIATAQRSPTGVFAPLYVGGELLSVRMINGDDELRGRSRELDKRAYVGGVPDTMQIGDGEYVDIGEGSDKYETEMEDKELRDDENTNYVIFEGQEANMEYGQDVVFKEVDMADQIIESIKRTSDFEGEYPKIVQDDAKVRAINNGAGWVIEKAEDGFNFIPSNAVDLDDPEINLEGAMQDFNGRNPDKQYDDVDEFTSSSDYGRMVLDFYNQQMGGTIDIGEPAQELTEAIEEEPIPELAAEPAPETPAATPAAPAETPLPTPPTTSGKISLEGFAIQNFVDNAVRAVVETAETYVPKGYKKYALRVLADSILKYETDEDKSRRLIGKTASRVEREALLRTDGVIKIQAYAEDDEANKVKIVAEDEDGEVLASGKIELPVAIASGEIPELLSRYVSSPAVKMGKEAGIYIDLEQDQLTDLNEAMEFVFKYMGEYWDFDESLGLVLGWDDEDDEAPKWKWTVEDFMKYANEQFQSYKQDK